MSRIPPDQREEGIDRGNLDRFDRHGAGQIIYRHNRSSVSRGDQVRDRRDMSHVLVAVGHHCPRQFHRRRPTMVTSAARDAFAVRTTVPMFRSWRQFSIATANSCRRHRGRDDGLNPPISVAVDDVAAITVGEQFGIEPRVIRPRLGVRPDPTSTTWRKGPPASPVSGPASPGTVPSAEATVEARPRSASV